MSRPLVIHVLNDMKNSPVNTCSKRKLVAMERVFNDSDRKKGVVTSDGQNVGRVRDVDGDRATVERSDDDDSLTEEVKGFLGWSDEDETHELRQDQVDRHDDNEVHLQPRR